MEIFIGTSGWQYFWNPDGLQWYIENTPFNAIELNASFYRFPFRNQVKGWAKFGDKLRWSIKVFRGITHYRKFSEKALSTWNKFHELFKPLENSIDFYLFQLPPRLKPTEKAIEKMEVFFRKINLPKAVIEWRHEDWFCKEWIKWAEELGVYVASIDAPIKKYYVTVRDTMYLRIHGREEWYSYVYSDKELQEIVKQVIDLAPKRVYVFFNNDHGMIPNGMKFLELINKML